MREEKGRRLYQILYRAFHVALLFGICLTGFGKQLGIQQGDIPDVLVAGIFLCALLGISYCQIRGKMACGIILLASLVMVAIIPGEEQMGDFWFHYIEWLVGGDGWKAEWLAGYELVQSCVIVLGCYLFQMLAERFMLIKDISAVMMLVNLLVCMYLEKIVGKVAVAFSLWYVILCFIERTQRYWNKKKGSNHREYVIRLLPFCVLYLVLMCLLPAPEKPYDWKFVKDAYHSIREKVIIWMQDISRNGQEDFAIAQTGFSEDGSLMSSLIESDKHLLTIQGSQGLKTNVYLVGKVYDTFDGREWTQTLTEDTNEHLMDTLETLYAVKRYDGELVEDYVYSTGLTVRYEYFNTGCVFVPLKLQSLNGCEYLKSGSNLVFEESKGYGTEYKTVYFQLNVDHPQFYQMAETQLPEDELVWEEVVRSYAPSGSRSLTLEELKQYQRGVIDYYGRELVLSEEALEYLAKLTAGKETVVEKLQAIEEELAGLSYSKSPGELPESVDSEGKFLDYFLLESREGYCAYFATAFVLMARAEGIPARYVEGFCVPVNANKNMVVTSGMAHAWPEVYLEGIGWIPFEPTPGYEEIRYTPWELKSEKIKGISLSDEEYLEDGETEVDASAEEGAVSQAEDNKFKNIFMLMGAVILVGCLLILVVDQLLFKRRYRQMSPKERFEVEIKRNLWLLLQLGYRRRDEETIAELRERVAAGFASGGSLYFLTIYEEYRYGSCEITADILRLIKEERKELLIRVKQTRKWYYYYILLRLSVIKVGVHYV